MHFALTFIIYVASDVINATEVVQQHLPLTSLQSYFTFYTSTNLKFLYMIQYDLTEHIIFETNFYLFCKFCFVSPHLKNILATKKGTRDQWALQHGAKVGFIGKKLNHSSNNLLILLIFYKHLF